MHFRTFSSCLQKSLWNESQTVKTRKKVTFMNFIFPIIVVLPELLTPRAQRSREDIVSSDVSDFITLFFRQKAQFYWSREHVSEHSVKVSLFISPASFKLILFTFSCLLSSLLYKSHGSGDYCLCWHSLMWTTWDTRLALYCFTNLRAIKTVWERLPGFQQSLSSHVAVIAH